MASTQTGFRPGKPPVSGTQLTVVELYFSCMLAATGAAAVYKGMPRIHKVLLQKKIISEYIRN